MKVVLSRPIEEAMSGRQPNDGQHQDDDNLQAGLGQRLPGPPPPRPQPEPQQLQPAFDERPLTKPPTRAPPRRVDHTYRDYSNYPLGELPNGKKAPTTNFPSKLHQILSTSEYAGIISWMPHGRAWKIHDKDLLIREVAPKYFVQSKYESFTRQLNGWGFKRLHQSGNDYNAYYHECFLRDLPHLTVMMKRVQPNKGKLLPHVEGEPNFYEIDRQFPLPRPPMMPPYQGHYPPPYSPSQHHHMASVAGYGHPSEPPAGYQGSGHYPPYPGHYLPSPYYGHDSGSDPHAAAAAANAMQPGYYPYYSAQFPTQYPTQYGHPPPPSHEQYPPYPYHSGHPPLGGVPPHDGNPPPGGAGGSVKSEEAPLVNHADHHRWAANEELTSTNPAEHLWATNEDRAPGHEEEKVGSFDPMMNVFAEPEHPIPGLGEHEMVQNEPIIKND